MITQKSIEEVKEKADLLEVIKEDTKLDRKGANYVGCCPFPDHSERTPSFVVNIAKGIYKCFGCGRGGNNSINYVMERHNMEFIEAIKYLADKNNIELEYDEKEAEPKEDQLKRSDYLKINKAAALRFQRQILDMKHDNWPHVPTNAVLAELLINRRLSLDTLISWQIGFAPDEWKFLTPILIERGLYTPAIDLGLVKTKGTNNYDVNRNRVMFPIHNERGEIVGFGGRKMEDNDKGNPKYINSRESMIYKKEKVLYGLYWAEAAIREMGYAIVVEGYYDVISFHQGGMANTVGPCGTAFTEGHAKLLKRYTKHLVFIGDGDKAGQNANLKGVDIALSYGFKVEICELPAKEDPDSFARSLMNDKELGPIAPGAEEVEEAA